MTMDLYPIKIIKDYLAQQWLQRYVRQLFDYVFDHVFECEESRIRVVCDEVFLHKEINNERNNPYVS